MPLTVCPVCAASESASVLRLDQLPVLINAQVRPHEAAAVPRGDIDLVVCVACGHLYNASFDSSLLDYDASYENTLHFSPAFQDFVRPLAERLVADHGLRGRRVAELGSGPGHFLEMLCEAGVAEAYGFDPSYDADRLGSPNHANVHVSARPFPDDGTLPVELALSQHVLEHLHDPVAALQAKRSAVVASGGVVYAEVPNGALMLDRVTLWDLIYEHVSYFVPSSLDTACRRAGLAAETMHAAFGEQFLWCVAAPTPIEPTALPTHDIAAEAKHAAQRFGDAARHAIEHARSDLAELAELGPVALWGAGSKGATYLNLVADASEVAAVVDINPRKAGWGVPGTELTIDSPESLVAIAPATVLIANPVYLDEIKAQLRARDIDAEVRPLWT